MARHCDHCKPDLCLFAGGGSGGGGGGVGVKAYTVTFYNSNVDEEYDVTSSYPISINGVTSYSANAPYFTVSEDAVTVKFLALDNYIAISVDCFSNVDDSVLPIVSGDIEFDSTTGKFFVSGNGTITLSACGK